MFIFSASHAEQIKVMSFNIRFNNPKDTALTSWDARRQPCGLLINTVKPDVIGMQEPRGEKQIADIKQMLTGYDSYEILEAPGYNIDKAGRIMIFYDKNKFTALKKGYFWLNDNPKTPAPSFCTTDRNNIRAAMWVKLKSISTHHVFYMVTTHTPYKKAPADNVARAKCAETIISQMKDIAGEKATIFIVGDLNACFNIKDSRRNSLIPFYTWLLDARIMSPLTDAKSSFNGFTERKDLYPCTLDYIFYRNATPLKFQTYDEPIWGVPYVSDHYPITCDFEINN